MNRDPKPLRRLLLEATPYRARVLAIVFFGLIVSIVQPIAVKLSQQIIDLLQQNSSRNTFVSLSFAILSLFVVGGIAKYLHQVVRRILSEQILRKIRTALYDKVLYFPIPRLERYGSGELLSLMQNDLNLLSQGLETICDLLKEPFTFAGLLAVAFYNDWQLTLFTLVAAPAVVFLFSWSGKAVKRYSKRNLEQFTKLTSLQQETIGGTKIVKLFGLESNLFEKFTKIQEEYFRVTVKSIKVQEVATPAVELIGASIMVLVVLYGQYRISAGELTAGRLVAFTIAIGLTQMPIKKLNNAFLKLKISEAAAERIYALMDLPDSEKRFNTPHVLATPIKKIRFEEVGLRYETVPVLNNVSFEVTAGETVAFVGKSGSGKSSLIHLLPRLYHPTHGAIYFNDVDIRELDLGYLRSLMSYVSQDTFLFNDTIYENIRYGRPSATAAEIAAAAEMAYCTDFIEKATEGFQTMVGDRGQLLSGGERQRIAIARAFLKGSPILILDEATSNLDSQSEKKVQAALQRLMVGKTAFVVAHRLSTIKKADKIFVIESGSIVEEGKHDHLILKEGLYSSFHVHHEL